MSSVLHQDTTKSVNLSNDACWQLWIYKLFRNSKFFIRNV